MEEKLQGVDIRLFSNVNRLIRVIDKYHVDYLLVEPFEYKTAKTSFLNNPLLRQKIKKIFDKGNYLIFEILK